MLEPKQPNHTDAELSMIDSHEDSLKLILSNICKKSNDSCISQLQTIICNVDMQMQKIMLNLQLLNNGRSDCDHIMDKFIQYNVILKWHQTQNEYSACKDMCIEQTQNEYSACKDMCIEQTELIGYTIEKIIEFVTIAIENETSMQNAALGQNIRDAMILFADCDKQSYTLKQCVMNQQNIVILLKITKYLLECKKNASYARVDEFIQSLLKERKNQDSDDATVETHSIYQHRTNIMPNYKCTSLSNKHKRQNTNDEVIAIEDQTCIASLSWNAFSNAKKTQNIKDAVIITENHPYITSLLTKTQPQNSSNCNSFSNELKTQNTNDEVIVTENQPCIASPNCTSLSNELKTQNIKDAVIITEDQTCIASLSWNAFSNAKKTQNIKDAVININDPFITKNDPCIASLLTKTQPQNSSNCNSFSNELKTQNTNDEVININDPFITENDSYITENHPCIASLLTKTQPQNSSNNTENKSIDEQHKTMSRIASKLPKKRPIARETMPKKEKIKKSKKNTDLNINMDHYPYMDPYIDPYINDFKIVDVILASFNVQHKGQ